MNKSTSIWLRGLVAALIGGGASAVCGGFANILVDPGHFNITSGLGQLAQTMLVTFIVSGIMSVMYYLKQSPVPAQTVEVTQTQTTTVTATPTDTKGTV